MKLRIGNHKLLIETGRYESKSQGIIGLCPTCKSNQIEDQISFTFSIVLNTVVFRDEFSKKKNREPNTKHNTITSYASHQKVNEF